MPQGRAVACVQVCLQHRRSEAVSRSKEAAAQTRYSATWVTKAREQGICAVCQRKFEAESECKEFIARFERNRCAALLPPGARSPPARPRHAPALLQSLCGRQCQGR